MQTSKKCASWSLATIVLLIVAAGGKALFAQNSGDAPRPATPAANDPWPEINLNVVVLNKQGAPQTLEVSGFQLFEDKSERPLHFRGSADSPVSLALLIDSSGSIFKHKDAIIAAVKAIVKGLPDGSEVTAVLFTDIAFLDLPFTAASKVDFSFLDRLQARGPTALYDAVVATEDHMLAHAKFARRSLVILSDGIDNASHVPRGEVFRKMEQPGAPVVYSCLLSKAQILQSELMAGRINMSFLAKRGGGTDFYLDPDPESTAAKIADAIRSQYVLHFTAADPARDGKAHKLEVRLPAKDLQIHALPLYYAPAQ